MSSRERWSAFLAKVTARVDEVLAEADPGFDELIATEVLDPVPLSSALSEFHARMLALEKKIDDSWAKIDAELDEPSARDALLEQGRTARKAIARKSKVLQVQKQAKAAHAIWALALEEMARPQKCSACGAPIDVKVKHEASNVTCTHCKAVSVVRPGMATLLFYQGICLHAFGEEAALEESARLELADEKYKALREKRRKDVDAWVQAHRRYWVVYARGYGTHVPGWSEAEVEKMATAKLGGLKWELERVETID